MMIFRSDEVCAFYKACNQPHFHFSDGFTNDGGWFDRVDNLLQGLQVRVIVCKLLFFVVEVTSSLKTRSNDEKT